MDLPNPEQFFLSTPLYEVIEYKDNQKAVIDIICFDGTIDGYCIYCKKESTFHRKGNAPPSYESDRLLGWTRTFGVILHCSRDKEHEIEVIFKSVPSAKLFLKIGQFPSIADLVKHEVQKYRKVLGPQKFKELTRSLGLISHGVGIGSFVYLRRIFEDLIEESHQSAATKDNWNEDNYRSKRMDEKIELLKGQLPNFLVKNKAMYGILSKGIHELTEQECLDIYPAMKLGIELILDEKIKHLEQEEKIKEGEKLIKQVEQEIKNKTTGANKK